MGAQVNGAAFGSSMVMWVVIAGIVLFRASRPQRTSVARMWIMAAILIVIAAGVMYASEMLTHASIGEIAIAVVVGLAAGIPLGLLRGRHTTVSATDRRGVMQLGPSWATAGIYLAAFALRAAIRFIVPVTSPLGTVIGDGLLIFAIAIVAGTYVVIYQKYEAVEQAVLA